MVSKTFLSSNKITGYLNKIKSILEIKSYSNSINSLYGYGIYNNRDIFFKLINNSEHNISKFINLNYAKYFNLCKIIDYVEIDRKYYLVIYENYKKKYKKIYNGIEFLNHIGIKKVLKAKTFDHTYNYLCDLTKDSLEHKITTKYPNKIFFEDRFGKKRLFKYYGLSYKILLADISHLLGNDSCNSVKKLFLLSKKIIGKKTKTFINISHGDLHDLNYCFYSINETTYDVLFLDTDTIGKNTFISDFVCHYWYLIYQGDYIIHKYNKDFFGGQKHIKKNLRDMQIKSYLKKYFTPIIDVIGSKYNWRDEFLRRLIMRILGVYNILEFEPTDRKKIYLILIRVLYRYKGNKSSTILPFDHVIQA